MISLKVSAILPAIPVRLAGKRTEKSPACMACKASSNSSIASCDSAASAWPLPLALGDGGLASRPAGLDSSWFLPHALPLLHSKTARFRRAVRKCPRSSGAIPPGSPMELWSVPQRSGLPRVPGNCVKIVRLFQGVALHCRRRGPWRKIRVSRDTIIKEASAGTSQRTAAATEHPHHPEAAGSCEIPLCADVARPWPPSFVGTGTIDHDLRIAVEIHGVRMNVLGMGQPCSG